MGYDITKSHITNFSLHDCSSKQKKKSRMENQQLHLPALHACGPIWQWEITENFWLFDSQKSCKLTSVTEAAHS